jgi:two-component system, chemotaxis family, protein-glutamate methylesterase/glutaminase
MKPSTDLRRVSPPTPLAGASRGGLATGAPHPPGASGIREQTGVKGPRERPTPCHHLMIIGASTGGTRVLPEILRRLPPLQAAVLVVQHMPRFINASFVRTLGRCWAGEARLAAEGDSLEDGLLLLAPSQVHCTLQGNQRIHLEAGPKVNFVCPAIDVTMKSLQAPLRVPVTGVLLTGMGQDGAEGLLHLRQLGAETLCQDQPSCAVYGMPAAAMALGAAEYQLTPAQIADRLAQLGEPGRTAGPCPGP